MRLAGRCGLDSSFPSRSPDAEASLDVQVALEALVHASEELHERRLACAVRAEDADLRSQVDPERDVLEENLAVRSGLAAVRWSVRRGRSGRGVRGG